MLSNAIQRLQQLCTDIPPLLAALDDRAFSAKPVSGGWSKAQILGHLIDSATNNHHRLVRAQFEDAPHIVYDQAAWNKHSYYDMADQQQLTAFWHAYNLQLLHLIRQLPEAMLSRTVNTGGVPLSMTMLIEDYVIHLEHHLHQLVAY